VSKEIANKEKSEVAIALDQNEWGVTEVSSRDIIIPRILLMQPMSDKVTAGDAAFGEFRESLNNEKLGDFKAGFEFVPFHMEKVFIEYKVNGQKKDYLRVVPITPQNEDLPYNDVEKGEDGVSFEVSRDRVMNFYVLLPSELEVGGAIPYILSARRTSMTAGKKLATQMFVKNIAAKKTPASTVCIATCGKQSNDEGTWAVMDVAPTRQSPDQYVVEALKWLKMIKAGKAKAHVESYNEDAPIVDVVRDVDAVDVEKSKF
jgi:hypothetical protein